jgi:type IV pilus assembly protein PilA
LGKFYLEEKKNPYRKGNQQMNSQIKLNLLKVLSNKKSNKGFTLIELLVVVVIVGVLAAIALPNLLGQVGKARESEAKSTLGALARAQQVYFNQKTRFAETTDALDIPVGKEKYYTIAVTDVDTALQLADGKDNAGKGTRDYANAVQYDSTDRTFSSILCRAADATKADQYDIDGTSITGGGRVDTATEMTCGADTVAEEVEENAAQP